MGGPLPCGRGRRPQHIHAEPPCAVQSDGQGRPAQALPPSDGPAPLPWPDHRPGAGGGVRGGAAPQPSSSTYHLVRWQGLASADDSWEPDEHFANCQELVAEYEAAAPCRPKAVRAHPRAGPAPLAQAATPPARRTPCCCPTPPNSRPDGRWRPQAGLTSPPPCSTGGRRRAGSSGASGAAAGGPHSPTSSAARRRPPPSRARSSLVDILLDPAANGSRWVSLTRVAPSG